MSASTEEQVKLLLELKGLENDKKRLIAATAGFEELEREHSALQRRLALLQSDLKNDEEARMKEFSDTQNDQFCSYVKLTQTMSKTLRHMKKDSKARSVQRALQEVALSESQAPILRELVNERSKKITRELRSHQSSTARLSQLKVDCSVAEEETKLLRRRVKIMEKKTMREESSLQELEKVALEASYKAKALRIAAEEHRSACEQLKTIDKMLEQAKSQVLNGRSSAWKALQSILVRKKRVNHSHQEENEDCGEESISSDDYCEMWCASASLSAGGRSRGGLFSGSMSMPELSKQPTQSLPEQPYLLPTDFTELSRRINQLSTASIS
jgi:hypothetical protein